MSNPDRLTALLAMAEDDPNDAFVLYGIAQEYATRDNHEDAETWYRRAIEADPDHAYAYYHLTRSLMAMKRASDAIETAKAGLAAAGRSGDAQATGELQDLLDEMLEPGS